MKKIIRLGTRGSPLALVQAEEVRKKFWQAHPDLKNQIDIDIIPIRTTGDWRPEHKERRFSDLGGNKELFTKEIEEALTAGQIDMAVHSMKDLSSQPPSNLGVGAILEREDPRDAFICSKAKTLDALPRDAVVGTSSLRRQSQILARRPDLRVVPLRGNIDTRLKKLAEGVVDATLLAVAGMTRLSVVNHIASIMPTEIMLPAAAQGALCAQIRHDDQDLRALLKPLHSLSTAVCVEAERAVLKKLDGSCTTPIGALARLKGGDQIFLEALIAKPDGSSLIRLHDTGPVHTAEKLGLELGRQLKDRLPADFFAA